MQATHVVLSAHKPNNDGYKQCSKGSIQYILNNRLGHLFDTPRKRQHTNMGPVERMGWLSQQEYIPMGFIKHLSRRQFIWVSALLALSRPWLSAMGSRALASSAQDKAVRGIRFRTTIAVLKNAYAGEMAAHARYVRYAVKAVEESYPNIAYLFSAFSVSEKIHADNFKRIAATLGAGVKESQNDVLVKDTKSNLKDAAKNELIKIEQTYPEYIDKLQAESHEQAITTCIYSLKCHRQHEEKICEIDTYCPWFFGSVARKIEGLKLDFHVCKICGSTKDERPVGTCEICSYPVRHYKNVKRPV
jgi:rubrerythrin